MLPDDPDQPKGIIRRLLPFTTTAMVIAMIYVGYIFYSRHAEQKEAEQQATEKQLADARKVNELYGGSQLKILNFYATAGPIHRGDSTQLCYGVSNAQSVKIDPDLKDLPSSYSNCVRVSPKKDTTYTLSATDKKGDTQQAVITIQVN
jgi:hypothetical protein